MNMIMMFIRKDSVRMDNQSIKKRQQVRKNKGKSERCFLTLFSSIDLRNKAAQLAIANNGNMPENYCGSCYGANPTGDANPCCNSCEDIQSAYSALGWNFNPDDFEQVNYICIIFEIHIYFIL